MSSRLRRAVAALLLLLPLVPHAEAPRIGPVVLARLPHDQQAYTQGLVWHAGILYESTGRYGESTLRRVDAPSGRVLAQARLPATLFGEGLARVGAALVQLTWKENQARWYDLASLRLVRTVPYPYEGWGATWDGRHLIVSDGSALLRFLDPHTLRTIRELVVREGETPQAYLNELEWAEGEILANVWGEARIARIDPRTGQVRGWLDLSALVPANTRDDPEAVANGIAYDPEGRRLYVTGKRWPFLFVLAWPPP